MNSFQGQRILGGSLLQHRGNLDKQSLLKLDNFRQESFLQRVLDRNSFWNSGFQVGIPLTIEDSNPLNYGIRENNSLWRQRVLYRNSFLIEASRWSVPSRNKGFQSSRQESLLQQRSLMIIPFSSRGFQLRIPFEVENST